MRKIIICSIVFLAGGMLNAQSLERTVIGSAGLAVQNSSAGLSFTVGEVATNSNSSTTTTATLTQGFQQTEVKNNIGVINIQGLNANAIVYPNPTVDMLNINSTLPTLGIQNLDYQVIDLFGKVVMEGIIDSNNGSIDVAALASSSYILVLSSGSDFNQRVKFTRI